MEPAEPRDAYSHGMMARGVALGLTCIISAGCATQRWLHWPAEQREFPEYQGSAPEDARPADLYTLR